MEEDRRTRNSYEANNRIYKVKQKYCRVFELRKSGLNNLSVKLSFIQILLRYLNMSQL